jgi:hypothetical protein
MTDDKADKAIAKLNDKAAKDLSDAERELTREQRISKAHNHALGVVKDAHIKEFNEAKVAEAKRLGVTWEPKLTEEERARKELEELLARHPSLEAALIRRVREDMLSAAEPAEPAEADPEPDGFGGWKEPAAAGSDESVAARAVVLGHVRQGRLSGDGETFAYPAGGDIVRTKDFRLVGDDTPLGPEQA